MGSVGGNGCGEAVRGLGVFQGRGIYPGLVYCIVSRAFESGRCHRNCFSFFVRRVGGGLGDCSFWTGLPLLWREDVLKQLGAVRVGFFSNHFDKIDSRHAFPGV